MSRVEVDAIAADVALEREAARAIPVMCPRCRGDLRQVGIEAAARHVAACSRTTYDDVVEDLDRQGEVTDG